MSQKKFLDKIGLQNFLNRIKALIPTKTSELQNDSGFITSEGTYDSALSLESEKAVQNKVVTAAINSKQDTLSTAQTNAVDSGITSAKVQGYDSHISDTDIHVTQADKTSWDSKAPGTHTHIASEVSGLSTVATSGSYNDLSNKPSIPSKTSDLTNDSGFLTSHNPVDSALSSTSTNAVQNKVINTELGKKANTTDLATVATSGSYADLSNKPSIPSKTSDLTNDSGFLTSHNPIDSSLSSTSTNAVQNKVVKAELDNKANSADLSTVATTGSYTDLNNIPSNFTPASHTHGSITNDGKLGTASRALITDGNKKIAVSSVTSTELGYLSGVTSAVQDQLDGKAASTHSHTASEVSGLATVATSGSYNDLANKPTIPTVNNATLTIQKNGTTVKTFTANASSNVTANITVPTKVSELTNDSGFLTSHNPVDSALSDTSTNAVQNKVVKAELDGKSDTGHTHTASEVSGLSSVATSGSYNDLTNKPTIPTVNNATLTIQKNGSTVKTFTANASSNVTANITVPTKVSELTNDSGFLTSASSLDSSKLTGTIDIDRLPKGALERLVTVADQTARFALTTSDVQLGDTVKQLDTGVMYIVTDEAKLSSADGYTEYTAGAATSVPWSGVTGKPSSYTPASHSHGNIANGGTLGTASRALITDGNKKITTSSVTSTELGYVSGVTSAIQTQLDGKAPSSHTHTASEVSGLSTVATSGSYNDLSNKPTIDTALSSTSTNAVQNKVINTALAGKAASSHTHTKSQITDFPTKTSQFTNDSHQTITVGTDTTSTASPAHSGTFTCIDSVTRDSNGHVTAVNTKTVTLPADNNTDTKVTNTLGTTTKAYVTGTTSATTNTGTQIFDTGVYLSTTAGELVATKFTGALNGNASTATQFSANKDVTLTGDVTGTASSKAGWSVATTLSDSGVTAGTYGPSADVTGNNNATISVPEITVDSKGRVTSVANRTLTCKNNTYNVYNKTLTIQKNGTNVATFTSNSNTDVTANITVPTKTSELTNDSGYLTSHQSLSNYVTLNGAQTISGNKTWSGEQTFSQTIQGNAATASAFDTAKSITLTGAVTGTVSGTNSWEIATVLKTGSVRTGGTVPAPYFKIASWEVNPNKYFGAILQIQNKCYPHNVGTLIISVRTKTDATFQKGYLLLNNAIGLLPSEFILCYKEVTGKVLCELYYYTTTSYTGIRFSVISEGIQNDNSLFNTMVVYQDPAGVAALPSDYTAIQTTIGTYTQDFIPYSTNTYNLGTSTNQWKSVYANAYYLGTTAFGDIVTLNKYNRTSKGDIEYSGSTAQGLVPTISTLAFWNGAYSGTTSNLAYCAKGAFGDIVTHSASEFLTSHQSLANYSTLANTVKSLSISGKTITVTPGSGSAYTLTTQDTVYTHPTTSGNKHIPSGGSSGQFLGWDSDGTAKWVNNPNTNTDTLMTQNVSTTNATYPVLLVATADATANQGAKTGIFAKSVKVNPSTNVISASGFSGPLTGNVTGNCSGSSGSCTGNAATATQFSANKSVTLTGDVTGTASSKAGWSVATTLANSGVTAGTYGPSADVTGNNNATISVPQITVDAKGRVTSVTNRTLTCKNNTYTVNNATLTIQKNGTNVATFTSNASANATANITVPTKVSELTNDSGFLTSHQSLANYVTLNGDQTISGAKTFTTSINTASTATTAREAWKLVFNKDSADTDSTAAAQIGLMQSANSHHFAALLRLANPRGDNKPTTGNTGNCWSGIGVFYNYDVNKGYPYAVNCWDWPASSNSASELASTSWVRTYCETTKGFLTSHQSLANYVTLDGDQTISGAKTFTNQHTVYQNTSITFIDQKLTGVTKGTNPSADVNWRINHTDANGDYIGRFFLYGKTNGLYRYNLEIDNGTTDARLWFSVDESQNIAFLPDTAGTHDLGTSANQWKAVYANAYYLGTTAFGNIVTHNASEFLTSHQSLANYSTLANTVKSLSISGKTITVTPGSGSAYTLTTQDTDTKVTQTVTTTNSDYPVLLCTTAGATATETNTSRFSKCASINARYGYLTLKNTYSSTCVTGTAPTADQTAGKISHKDYNGNDAGTITTSIMKTSGTVNLTLRAHNKITSGALDPDASTGSTYLTLAYGTSGKVLTTDAAWNSNVTPLANNSKTLGTSSLKWKEAHAVNFYENGTALSSKYLTVSAISGGASTSAGNITPVIGTIILGFAESDVVSYSTNFGGVLTNASHLFCAFCVYNTSTLTMEFSKGPAIGGTGTWKLMGGVTNPGVSTKLLFGLWIKIA